MGARFAMTLVLAAALAGCTSAPWRKVPLDATSGLYKDATLTYRLDAGQLGQPLDVVRVEAQRVTCEQVATSPVSGETIGTLRVIYPHPSGRAGSALVRFVLDGAGAKPAGALPKGWNPFAPQPTEQPAPLAIAGTQPALHETWELDIAAVESEQIFKMLSDLGFYTSERPAGPARLTVTMNGSEQTKAWDQIAALNQLIQRVRAQGRLVAYSRPATASGTPASAIASTAAYRQLAAQLGTGQTAAPPQINAFSLAVPPLAAPMGPALPGAGYPAVAGLPANTIR
jgi:hypothetical protein